MQTVMGTNLSLTQNANTFFTPTISFTMSAKIFCPYIYQQSCPNGMLNKINIWPVRLKNLSISGTQAYVWDANCIWVFYASIIHASSTIITVCANAIQQHIIIILFSIPEIVENNIRNTLFSTSGATTNFIPSNFNV